jgi:hypothetical protein
MPSVVQSAGFCPAGNVSSVNGSLPANVGAGNLLVAFASASKMILKPPAPQLDTISDSAGLTWTQHGYVAGTGNRVRVWSAVAPSGGAVSVTVTPATAPDISALTIVELAPDSGRVWSATSASRVSATGTGFVNAGTQVATTSAITTAEDGVIVAQVAVSLDTDDSLTPDSAWTELFENEWDGGGPIGSETKTVNLVAKPTTAGTYTPTWNITDNCKWACAGVAFKDSAP